MAEQIKAACYRVDWASAEPDAAMLMAAMKEEIAELRAALEAQQGDASRMDWLETQNHIHALQWSGATMHVKTSLYDRNRTLIAEGATLRAAIDAALAARGE